MWWTLTAGQCKARTQLLDCNSQAPQVLFFSHAKQLKKNKKLIHSFRFYSSLSYKSVTRTSSSVLCYVKLDDQLLSRTARSKHTSKHISVGGWLTFFSLSSGNKNSGGKRKQSQWHKTELKVKLKIFLFSMLTLCSLFPSCLKVVALYGLPEGQGNSTVHASSCVSGMLKCLVLQADTFHSLVKPGNAQLATIVRAGHPDLLGIPKSLHRLLQLVNQKINQVYFSQMTNVFSNSVGLSLEQ